MGYWKFLEPAEAYNYAAGGSLENGLTWQTFDLVTFGMGNKAATLLELSESCARFGNKSAHVVTPAGAGKGVYMWFGMPAGWPTGAYYASVYVRALVQFTATLKVYQGGLPSGTLRGTVVQVIPGDGAWHRITCPVVDNGLAGSGIDISVLTDAAAEFWLDGFYYSQVDGPYFDGDTPGCRWVFKPHESISHRPAELRTGGVWRDFETYGFYISAAQGCGVPRVEQQTEAMAFAPGSQHQGLHIDEREFALIGKICGDDYPGLLANRAALARAIRPFDLDAGLVQFEGGTKAMQLAWRYASGLEGGAQNVASEPLTLKGLATEPMWIEDNQVVATLTHQSNLTSKYAVAKRDGTWQAVPGDLNGLVRAMAHDAARGYTYIGGDFTLTWGNTWQYLIRCDGNDSYPLCEYASIGVANQGPDGPVYALLMLNDGRLLIGGDFTHCKYGVTVVATNYIAVYDPATQAFSSWGGNSGTGPVYALAQHPKTGDVYAGGNFTNWAAIAAADYLVRFVAATGYTASAISTGTNAIVRSLACTPSGVLFIGGNFTASGSGVTTLNYLAQSTDGTTITQVLQGTTVGVNGQVWAVKALRNGGVALAGDFTTAGGINANRVAIYTGNSFRSLGAGINNTGRAIEELPNEHLMVGGSMTVAGTLTVAGLATWNGAAWCLPEILYGGGPVVYAIAAHPINLGDVWVGHDSTLGCIAAANTTVDNPGTADVFPDMVFRGPSGFVPICITNLSLPHQPTIWFDPSLFNANAGEVVTLHTGKPPENREQVESSRGRKGLGNGIITGSSLATFYLRPGPNRLLIRSASAAAGSLATVRWQPVQATRDS